MKKRDKIIYWAITLILFVPAGIGGVIELVTDGPANIAQIMLALGFPLYLMKILGFAKTLGAIAILSDKSPRLKEWAYAGFAFDFLGATASHILAGDSAHAWPPFLFFVVMMGSYFIWHQPKQGL